MKILNVCGARPNFVKIAPLMRAYTNAFDPVLVHTGQHYDESLSRSFFEDLGIPEPAFNLGVGSGSHAVQTARILERFDPVLSELEPDLVLVVGDVNSTLACALAAAKRGIPVAHVEAGLRSFDRRMPEEINRVLTDSISDFLFVSEPAGEANLRQELGETRHRDVAHKGGIHFVGNTMIDSLVHAIAEFGFQRPAAPAPDAFVLVTVHRAANTADIEALSRVTDAIEVIQDRHPVLFPMHPRTRAALSGTEVLKRLQTMPMVRVTGPLGYRTFIRELLNAAVVLTDSGGLQEECAFLGTPCLTLRNNTERPVTLNHGNRLVGTQTDDILAGYEQAVAEGWKRTKIDKWDGHAAERIVGVLRGWADAPPASIVRGANGERSDTFQRILIRPPTVTV